jgi:hypothetical protein
MFKAGHGIDEPYLQSLVRRYQALQYSSLKKKLNFTIDVSALTLRIKCSPEFNLRILVMFLVLSTR